MADFSWCHMHNFFQLGKKRMEQKNQLFRLTLAYFIIQSESNEWMEIFKKNSFTNYPIKIIITMYVLDDEIRMEKVIVLEFSCFFFVNSKLNEHLNFSHTFLHFNRYWTGFCIVSILYHLVELFFYILFLKMTMGCEEIVKLMIFECFEGKKYWLFYIRLKGIHLKLRKKKW